MSSERVPDRRCGFVLEPEDLQVDRVPDDYETGSNEWYEDSDAVCCWREVWSGDDDRCIWHAKTDDKSADDLIDARADGPERLDGAYVPGVELGHAIDFEGCGLQGVTFNETGLRKMSFADVDGRAARFPNTNLVEAQFPEADFGEAQFPDAALQQAQFPDAFLVGARFPDANLGAAEFPNAVLALAQFPDTSLHGAQFPGADLYRARFPDAFLVDAQFPDADLLGAEFPDADLAGSRFPGAHLPDARFPDASLRGAEFPNANLEGAELNGANLFDADLRETDLYGVSFTDVSVNRRTTFGAHYIPTPPRGVWARLSRVGTIGRELRRALTLVQSDSTDEERLGKAAWTYRTIERLSEDAGLSKQARSYNVQRKDIERRLYLVEDGSRWRWAMAMLSSLSMRYGQRPWRVVGLSVVAIVAAAAGYAWQGLRLTAREGAPVIGAGAGTVPLPTLIGKSLYFSTITFTTVGYGDIQPVGWSQTIATIESFLGALLMALLVYVLGRRATW